MKPIDGDALKEKILTLTFTENNTWALNLLICLIDDAPTVEPPKPKRESRAMLPCICGCRRREHWFGADCEALVCKQCGRKVSGKNAMDAIRNWNREMGDDGNADTGKG